MMLVGPQERHLAYKKYWGGWWRWALVSLDRVATSRMVAVSASVNLPLHHKVQSFSSGTGSPEWSWKKGHKTVVVYCGGTCTVLLMLLSFFLFSWHSFHSYCLLECVSPKWQTFGFVSPEEERVWYHAIQCVLFLVPIQEIV